MGKCKKRTLHKTNSTYIISRNDAVNDVLDAFVGNSNKNENSVKHALDLISLFGISAEELSEAGMPYENLKALGSLIS